MDESGHWKVDLIFSKPVPFDRAGLLRRMPSILLDVPVFVATPEDTILAKLEWAKLGGSDQQMRDVSGIVEMKGEELDHDYIERWLDELGVRELWDRVQRT